MKWLEKGRILDTERATRVLDVPPRMGLTSGQTGSRWLPKDLGLKGRPRAMADVAIWVSDDGTWFLTSNPVTRRLSDDKTSVRTYRSWDDPSRTHEDLSECCRILTPRQTRRICSKFMSAEEYLRTFPDQAARRGEQMTFDSGSVAVMGAVEGESAELVVRQ